MADTTARTWDGRAEIAVVSSDRGRQRRGRASPKIGGRPLYRHIEYEEGEQAREAGAVVRGDEEADKDEHGDGVVG
jgi:hypothetical protein